MTNELDPKRGYTFDSALGERRALTADERRQLVRQRRGFVGEEARAFVARNAERFALAVQGGVDAPT